MFLRFVRNVPGGARVRVGNLRALGAAALSLAALGALGAYAATDADAGARAASTPTATVKIALDYTANVNYLGPEACLIIDLAAGSVAGAFLGQPK